MADTSTSRVRRDDSSTEPRTPQNRTRPLVSSFGSSSSPISSFRNEEDAIILECGSRWLRAGLEGENAPMCTVGFGPEESRKVGDYRGWTKSKATDRYSRAMDAEEWVREHELWRMDLRELDLALFEDKLERAVRDVYNRYLLTDAGNARLVVVLPSIMPHTLLSATLATLFNRWRFPTITLLPSATMVAAAAGIRSALVVDIGWGETVVTGIFEYREIASKRSTRAMRMLLQEMGRTAMTFSEDGRSEVSATTETTISTPFEYCEELVSRLAWCRTDETDDILNATITIPSPSTYNPTSLTVPFSRLAEPAEKTLFASGIDSREIDDQEQPIHILIYKTLLTLPPDVRGTCMSRICFVGGGSKLPGVRRRIMSELASLVKVHGWSAMRGRAVEHQRKRLQELNINQAPHSSTQETEGSLHSPSETRNSLTEPDFIEQKLRRHNRDHKSAPLVQGVFREVESLGAWAGASLVTNLKIRGIVEIEREKFLQQGLASASRDLDHQHQHVADRRSGFGTGTGRSGDQSSWTLAGWG